MKYILRVIVILLTLNIIMGCQSKKTDIFFGNWDSENAESDSLVCLLEQESLLDRGSLDTILNQIGHLEKISPKKAAFYKGRFLRIYKHDAHAQEILLQLKNTIDSAQNVYLTKRINRELALLTHKKLARFIDASKELNYYKSINDPLTLAACYIDLGNTFADLHDFDKAVYYIESAQDIYKENGLEPLYVRNKINLARIYKEMGLAEFSDSIYTALLNTESLNNDPRVREIILRNSFLNTLEPGYMWEALSLSRNNEDLKNLFPLHASILSSYYLENEELDSAIFYANMAKATLDQTTNLNHLSFALFNIAQLQKIEGKPDSAIISYDLAMAYADSSQLEMDVVKVETLEAQRAIAALEIESVKRMSRERLVWAIVIFLVVISTIIALWIANKRHQTAKLQQMQSQLELEQERRSFAAKTLAMEEKERIIGETRKRLEEMSNEGKIKNDVASELVSMIKMHESGQIEWDNFVTMFEKVSPNFTKNLKDKYPTLSENYVKLATYLFAGMTSFQIARLLMIRPESVHQARWRLRKKMNIPSEVTIEDALRELG